jgi:hypothetical protein
MDIASVFAILNLVVQAFLRMVVSPLFWIIVVIIYFQYRRINQQKELMFGIKEQDGWRHALLATGHGVIGGLVGSGLIVFMGVSLSGIGIQFLWLLAITLMLVSPRFICFAYAGGIISLSSIIFGYPQVDIPMLMGLVAILHMVESVLILVSGHMGALPLYTKLDDGRMVGGFNLQKFWPIPLVALALMVLPDPSQVSGVGMPDWWPLIKPSVTGNPDNFVYALLPVVAALGYGDLALTSKPREKSKKSAFFLGLYSLILLALAVLASRNPSLVLLPALFSLLGHELVIKIGRDVEFKGQPKYVAPEKGIMVLAVLEKSAAKRMGLKTGDIIFSVNTFPVNSRRDLTNVLHWGGTVLETEYMDSDTGKYSRTFTRKGFHEPFGVILVPEGDESQYVELTSKGFLARWWESRKKN